MKHSIRKKLLLSLAISSFSSLSYAEITRSEALAVQTPWAPKVNRTRSRAREALREGRAHPRKCLAPEFASGTRVSKRILRQNVDRQLSNLLDDKKDSFQGQEENRELAALTVKEALMKEARVKKALQEIGLFCTKHYGFLPDLTNTLSRFISMFPDELKSSSFLELNGTTNVFSLANALSMIINNSSTFSNHQSAFDIMNQSYHLRDGISEKSHLKEIRNTILHSIEFLSYLPSKSKLITKLLKRLKNIVLSHKVLFTDEEQNNVREPENTPAITLMINEENYEKIMRNLTSTFAFLYRKLQEAPELYLLRRYTVKKVIRLLGKIQQSA